MNVGNLIAAITAIMAAAVSWWGAYYTAVNTSRELDIRMVDVALSILSAKDEATKSKYAKVYAFDILEKYSGVEIKDREKWEIEGIPLDFGPWPGGGRATLGWCDLGDTKCQGSFKRLMESGFLEGTSSPAK